MGGQFLITLLIVVMGGAVATAGVIGGSIAISKAIAKRKAHEAEKHLRNELEKNFVNHHKIRALVKKYYKTQIKVAPLEAARKAKLNYFILAGKKGKKIRKLKLFEEKQIVPNGTFQYTEKIVYDQNSNLSVELPSNSILSNSQTIVDDYKLALSATQSSPHFKNRYFFNRNYKGGVYPIELNITDSTGKKVAFLSDVSAGRFYEFTQRLMAKLYLEISKDKVESYTITMIDNAVNPKIGKSQISYNVSDSDSCKKALFGLNEIMFYHYKGFNSNQIASIDFDELVSLYKYDSKQPQSSSNGTKKMTNSTLGLVYKDSNLDSEYLNEIFEEKTREFRYQNNNDQHYITSLIFNGQEIISFEAENFDVGSSMKVYLAAYAFVKGYQNFNENDIRNNIQISTKVKNLTNNVVYEHSNQKLVDFFNINNSFKNNANFQEAVAKIAEEKKIVIEPKKLKDPEKMSKKSIANDSVKADYNNKIATNRPNLEKLFANEINAQTDKGSIAYITRITNNLDTENSINLKLDNNSKTIQKNYFYQLMLEAYVIGKHELSQTKKLSPITASVNFLTLSSTFEEKPKDRKETFNTLDELKKSIITYARVNFGKAYTNEDFESEIKNVEDDFNSMISNTFIF